MKIKRCPPTFMTLALLAAGMAGHCEAAMLDIINVTSPPYNATANDGSDDRWSFQMALNALENSGGGYLHIPNGTYNINGQVTLNNTTSTWSITIAGQTRGGAILRGGNQTSGIFSFVAGRSSRLMVRNLTLQAGCAGGGVALAMSQPVGSGTPAWRSLTMDNVAIGKAGPSDYFNTGVQGYFMYRASISNTSFDGYYTADWGTIGPSYGFDFRGVYGPVFQQCTVTGAQTAFYYELGGDYGNSEGGWYDHCTVSGCNNGVYLLDTNPLSVWDPEAGKMRWSGRQPCLTVSDCTITAKQKGIWIEGRNCCQFTDNTMNQGVNAAGLHGMDFHWLGQSVVLRNTFNGTLLPGEKNIYLTYQQGDAVDPIRQSWDDILGSNDIAGTYPSAAIYVDPTSTHVMQYDNY